MPLLVTEQSVPETLEIRKLPYTVPSAPAAPVSAEATPSCPGSQTGIDGRRAVGGARTGPRRVAVAGPAAGVRGAAGAVGVALAARAPAVRGAAADLLSGFRACVGAAAALRLLAVPGDGRVAVFEPAELATCTNAGTAVPMSSAAAAMPTTACRFRARRAGTARFRWSRVPSAGSSSWTALRSMRRRATSSMLRTEAVEVAAHRTGPGTCRRTEPAPARSGT